MLANALFYIALIAIVSTTMLSAGLAIARVATHRAAQTYLDAGYQRAISSLQQTLRNDMQAGALPSPLPTFAPIPASCVDAGAPCRYRVAETIALFPSNSDAGNEQANAYVGEDRVAARIAVTVSAADGTTLATRADDVLLRLVKTAPYVVLAGSRDASFDDVRSDAGVGDDGGAAPATPNPCASSSIGTADGTQIRVAYQNVVTKACSDGSSWRSTTSAPSTPPQWSP